LWLHADEAQPSLPVLSALWRWVRDDVGVDLAVISEQARATQAAHPGVFADQALDLCRFASEEPASAQTRIAVADDIFARLEGTVTALHMPVMVRKHLTDQLLAEAFAALLADDEPDPNAPELNQDARDRLTEQDGVQFDAHGMVISR
jgi:hypothetical protein